MNPKLILGLALVLSGGLIGCSSVPSGALSNSAEGKLFSNQEAVCLKSDDVSRPWLLKYAVTGSEGRFFVTVHERRVSLASPEYYTESTAAIYVKLEDKFKLLKRLYEPEDGGGSRFLEPNIFPTTPKKDHWQTLIQITELFDGTGYLTHEHIFAVDWGMTVNGIKATPKLEEVEFIPAWESFKDFGKDEELGKGQINTLTEDGLFFTFVVWKDENPGESPVGKITGTYKLEKKSDGGLRIIMDKFKREPITDSGS
jgi:hypothetical protein